MFKAELNPVNPRGFLCWMKFNMLQSFHPLMSDQQCMTILNSPFWWLVCFVFVYRTTEQSRLNKLKRESSANVGFTFPRKIHDLALLIVCNQRHGHLGLIYETYDNCKVSISDPTYPYILKL